MNIYIGNLSPDVNDADLETAFKEYGKVTSAKVIKDMFSQESKGFGFVEMPGKNEAASAIEKLNTTELKGKRIIVNEAKPKRSGGRNRRF
jgi:RNA recognition motif-containing protein